jgi:ABC-type amino acid transport substrate-binding protein
MIPWIKVLILLIGAFSVTSFSLHGRESLTFGVFQFEPWGFNNQGSVIGVVPDQMRVLSAYSDVKFEMVYMPYKRLIADMVSGKVDCSIYARYDTNQEHIRFINKMYDLNVVVVFRKGFGVKSIQSLEKSVIIKSIGWFAGAENFLPKKLIDQSIYRVATKSQKQGLELLAKGRIDAFIGVESTLNYLQRAYFSQLNLDPNKVNLAKLPIWLQCSKHSNITEKTFDKLQAGVKTINRYNAMQITLDKWFK